MPGIIKDSKAAKGSYDGGRNASHGSGASASTPVSTDYPYEDPFSPSVQTFFPKLRTRLLSQLVNPNYLTPISPIGCSGKQPGSAGKQQVPLPIIRVEHAEDAVQGPAKMVPVPEIRIDFPEASVEVKGPKSSAIPEIKICEDSIAPRPEVAQIKETGGKQKLKFLLTGEETEDALHQKSTHSMSCTPDGCRGSFLMPDAIKQQGQPRTKKELLALAEDFINQYYENKQMLSTPQHVARWEEVSQSIAAIGTYHLTIQEVTLAAKLAWRNSARCIGRKQWTRLQVFDFRQISTAFEMYEALCSHLRYATNGGTIRSALTLFPHLQYNNKDFKLWNKMLISYAGYEQEDGSVIGDPSNVRFTRLCTSLGWQGKGGRFDILPWLLQAAGHKPELYEIPEDLVLRVQITHPRYPGLEELGLEWYSVPGISSMVLDCGGIEFACPFNGWYMTTEIAIRNFLDTNRYNMLPVVAEKMGLDSKTQPAMWKDLAAAEMNIAVLTSFQKAGVTITDQHTACEMFMSFLRSESLGRGGCPADWVWLVPPISGSLTPVFHQEMLNYRLSPSYEYQTMPWEVEDIPVCNVVQTVGATSKADVNKGCTLRTPIGLNRRMSMRRVRCAILYATETGKSEQFAGKLYKLFNQSFATSIRVMEDYDVLDLRHEDIVLIVASTFGNGDPPENGETFAKECFGMMCKVRRKSINSSATAISALSDAEVLKTLDKQQLLENVRFSVFALGSSMYRNFCAFGRYLDSLLEAQGGERMFPRGEGDDMFGQAEEFRQWSEGVFKAACHDFCIEDNHEEIRIAINNATKSWTKEHYRLESVLSTDTLGELAALKKTHGTSKIFPMKLKKTKQLQASSSERQTILVELSADEGASLDYLPGDHLCVHPHNRRELVEQILSKTTGVQPDDTVLLKIYDASGDSWNHGRLPACSLKTALTKYMDVTQPPEIDFVRALEQFAADQKEKEKLRNLVEEIDTFSAWINEKFPTLCDILDEFPSVTLPAEFLLSHLPVLKPRFYSISSSERAHPGEVHLTVAVLKYKTEGGSEHYGVCSNWLNSLGNGHFVYVSIRRATNFRLPALKQAPILMVGPGTGIAPFRAFWQQRSMEMIESASRTIPESFGPMTFYFGCRQPEVDDIMRDERDKMMEHKVITAQHSAYSRQADKPKVYVQHLMAENKVAICKDLVEGGGHIYVCGDSTMASDVRAQVENIIHSVSGVTLDEARAAVNLLKEQNRYHEDIFGATFNLNEKIKQAAPVAREESRRRVSCIEPDIPEVNPTPTGNLLGVPRI